jgi:pimeloyl-ACP methyl ester carboxylesterase
VTTHVKQRGSEFGDTLAAQFNANDCVAIIGHSMGGLVSRFAILSQRLEFVKALYLLGTPNSGALRLSQLTALAQLLHGAANGFRPIFARNPGVISLSQVAKLIEAQRSRFENALGIDYVSIPGLYFYRDRTIWEWPKNVERAKFTALQFTFFLFYIGSLGRPHDGIVDEASNHLARRERDTEKLDSYRSLRDLFPKTYMHLSLAPCREANHVEIHKDPVIISVVADLIASKFADPSTKLENWVETKSTEVEWFQKGLNPQFGRGGARDV